MRKRKNQDDTKSDEAEILDSNISARPFENTGKRDSKKRKETLLSVIFFNSIRIDFFNSTFYPRSLYSTFLAANTCHYWICFYL